MSTDFIWEETQEDIDLNDVSEGEEIDGEEDDTVEECGKNCKEGSEEDDEDIAADDSIDESFLLFEE